MSERSKIYRILRKKLCRRRIKYNTLVISIDSLKQRLTDSHTYIYTYVYISIIYIYMYI